MSDTLLRDSLAQSLNTAMHEIIRRGALPRVLRRLNDEAGAAFDRSSYWVAVRLAETGGIRLSQLAELQGTDLSTISRQVQVCEQAGIVERRTDPTDARATLVQLTVHGREMLERVLAVQRADILDAMSDWTSDEQLQFAELLSRFASRFHAWAVSDVQVETSGGVPTHT
jgi:DNA-binding MarR family transcriptional regulator